MAYFLPVGGGRGLFCPSFFTPGYFDAVTRAHVFQDLTESDKPGKALRTGIYLSELQHKDGECQFHLMRCSTNFQGPTEGFAPVDREILAATNAALLHHMPGAAPVNHVLAQVYHNAAVTDDHGKQREKKAVIARHSDKTKDMAPKGVLAFATFYSTLPPQCRVTEDGMDVVYGKHDMSVLTRMHFRAKEADTQPAEFTVTLTPNSLLLVDLNTNRLYTHEVKASVLPVHLLPTRLGYVMRCSNQAALHKDGTTYLVGHDGALTAMTPATPEDVAAIKAAYLQENKTTDVMHYPPFTCSLNQGDYTEPKAAVIE